MLANTLKKGANLPKQSPTQFSQVQRPSCCCHNFVTRHKHSFNTSQLSWKSICNWWEIFYLFLGQRSKVVEGGALSLIIPFCHVIISQPGDTSLSRGSFSIICNLSLKLDSIRLSHPWAHATNTPRVVLQCEKHFKVSSPIREDNRFQLFFNHGCPFCPSFYEWWSYDQTSACGPPALPGTHPPHILSQAQLPQATLWAGRTGTGSV